jgi:ATP-dependent RNA helicase RhlE
MSFQSLGLNESLLRAITETGYTDPTPIQAESIPVILEGRDLIGIAQTGTGKTAAFTLPLLHRLRADAPKGRTSLRTLILAPTRELVVQIAENVATYAKYLPVRITQVFGGVSERPQIQALRGGTDVVIATPGRLLDLMSQGCVNFQGMEHLVLDEADRMLDMGFLPSIRKVVKALPIKRQTLLFSATLSGEIETLARDFQVDPKVVEIGRRTNPAETVTQSVYEVKHHLKTALLSALLRDSSMSMVLVFTRTKHGADRVARRLEAEGVKTATIHANRSQNQRLRALEDFRAGRIRVLVATDIASRGIDVDGISHVVNFDFPPQAEDYVHRIGRTGRAQAVGEAISFVMQDDLSNLRFLERKTGRMIPRKALQDFDYNAPEPPRAPRPDGPSNRGGGNRGGAGHGFSGDRRGGGGGGGGRSGGGNRAGGGRWRDWVLRNGVGLSSVAGRG